MTTACPGGASYEIMPDYRIVVNGSAPVWSEADSQGKAFIARLKKAWETYGPAIQRATEGSGFPVPWFMGILCAESLGNVRACSPCGQENGCSIKNCTGCCAYGIMQIIDSTARQYGGVTGPSLLGNPEMSFKVATNLFKALSQRYGLDLVKIASAYNSGGVYCGSVGKNLFGNNENPGYTQRVVTFANTANMLGMGAGGMSSQQAMNTVLGMGLILGAGWAWFKYLR